MQHWQVLSRRPVIFVFGADCAYARLKLTASTGHGMTAMVAMSMA